jgi:hypothetical protein
MGFKDSYEINSIAYQQAMAVYDRLDILPPKPE